MRKEEFLILVITESFSLLNIRDINRVCAFHALSI